MIANNLTPFIPTHPGEVIKDELEARGITQRQLADVTGISYSVINEVLNGKRPVTTKTALLFEAALGLPAESLMRLQLKYELHTARFDESFAARINSINNLAFA